MHDHGSSHRSPASFERLDDLSRLQRQVSEAELTRLLALRGDEDVLDLGSGTGFYTDRIAALTAGMVYALDLDPAMHDHYRARGLPANVRLVLGDMTALSVSKTAQGEALRGESVDVACTIATWHEIEGRLDLPGVAQVLRPGGRLLVIDWRRDVESWENGPPIAERSTAAEVAGVLASHFTLLSAENVGRFMFAVTAGRD